MNDSLDTTVPTPPFSPLDRWAEVRVAGRVTRYARRGSGAPIIVLQAPDAAADHARALWPALADALAAGGRVLLPEVPAPDARPDPVERPIPADIPGFLEWIRGFLDGLGLPPATVIAAEPYCLPALELALLEPERLAGLVLVPERGAAETGLTGGLTTTTAAGEAVRLLVVRRDCPAAEAVPLVARFVAGPCPPPEG